MSNVVLKIGGVIHDGWKTAQVALSIERVSGAFQVGLTDKWGDGKTPRQLKPGDSCEVAIDGQVVITGYIDRVEPSYDAESHSITVTGRDKAGDLFDCSVITGTGEWKGQKLEAIAKALCLPFGIPVITEVDTSPVIPTFNVEQGMTVFEALQKLCSLRACLAVSDGRGGITITRASATKVSTPLLEGGNILAATATYDVTERYSQYICKGQQQGDDNLSAEAITAPKATITDANISRYRPLVVITEGQADTQKCKLRAKWEATVRRAKSRTFTITVPGWKMLDGQLWPINRLVVTQSAWLGVYDALLISEVNYRLDGGGELTDLTLVPAEAYVVIDDDTIERNTKKGKKGEEGNPYLSA